MSRFAMYANCRDGVFWLRLGSLGFSVNAPWRAPMFSERYGHRKPIAQLLGWRVFRLSSEWH